MRKFMKIGIRTILVSLLAYAAYSAGYSKGLNKGFDVGYPSGIYDFITNPAQAVQTLTEIQARQ